MKGEFMTCQVIVTQEENWLVAKDIGTNVASQGKTISDALTNLKEALELYYEDKHETEPRYPAFLTTLEVSV